MVMPLPVPAAASNRLVVLVGFPPSINAKLRAARTDESADITRRRHGDTDDKKILFHPDRMVAAYERRTIQQIESQVQAARWAVSARDCYALRFPFQFLQLFTSDLDNFFKIVIDCLVVARALYNDTYVVSLLGTKAPGEVHWHQQGMKQGDVATPITIYRLQQPRHRSDLERSLRQMQVQADQVYEQLLAESGLYCPQGSILAEMPASHTRPTRAQPRQSRILREVNYLPNTEKEKKNKS